MVGGEGGQVLTCRCVQLACQSWAPPRLSMVQTGPRDGHGWPFSQAYIDRWLSIPQPQMCSERRHFKTRASAWGPSGEQPRAKAVSSSSPEK